MRKLDYLQQKKLSRADELREQLSSLENRRTAVNAMTPTEALFLLRDLDQTSVLFNQLASDSLDLTPEIYRFDAIQNHYKNRAAVIQRALGGAEAISRHRPVPEPERARWWWYMPELVKAQQQRALRRVLISFIIFLLIVGSIAFALETFLAPSPEAVARLEAENASFTAFEDGDFNKVIAEIDAGLAVAPNDPGLLIIKGVAQEQLGDDQGANQSYEQARANLPDPGLFYLQRGQVYFRANQLAKVEEDARTALKLNENLPLAWLLLGQTLEVQGRRFEAISAYQEAGNVALENGNNEVVVLARLALSRIGGFAAP
jgi:tetratricopeptide (TPR) repeat protein